MYSCINSKPQTSWYVPMLWNKLGEDFYEQGNYGALFFAGVHTVDGLLIA